MARWSTCSSCRVNWPRSECAHDTEAVERSGAEDTQSLSLELVVGQHACGMGILKALKPVVDRVNVGRRVEDRVRRRIEVSGLHSLHSLHSLHCLRCVKVDCGGRLRAPTAHKDQYRGQPAAEAAG